MYILVCHCFNPDPCWIIKVVLCFNLTERKHVQDAQLILSPDHKSNQERQHCTVSVLEPSVYTVTSDLLTPWCRVLLEKLPGLQLVKKLSAFHATRRFITTLTSVRHLSLSWVSPIQSIYTHPTSWRSILILSAHLCLGLPSGLLPSSFPTKTLYTPLSSPIRATCPAHLILLCNFRHNSYLQMHESDKLFVKFLIKIPMKWLHVIRISVFVLQLHKGNFFFLPTSFISA